MLTWIPGWHISLSRSVLSWVGSPGMQSRILPQHYVLYCRRFWTADLAIWGRSQACKQQTISSCVLLGLVYNISINNGSLWHGYMIGNASTSIISLDVDGVAIVRALSSLHWKHLYLVNYTDWQVLICKWNIKYIWDILMIIITIRVVSYHYT